VHLRARSRYERGDITSALNLDWVEKVLVKVIDKFDHTT
jgi:hypothetical protein